MFIAALAVPAVFDDEGVLFGDRFPRRLRDARSSVCLGRPREPRDLPPPCSRLAPWTLLGATFVAVAGYRRRAHLAWLAALGVIYFGAVLSGSTGWHLHPSHFAERHALVVIIALGEAFISIGIGATGIRLGLGEVVAAILGLLVATSFWLAYFDFFSIRGERMLGERDGPGGSRSLAMSTPRTSR